MPIALPAAPPIRPSARVDAAMAYDPAGGDVILYGGLVIGSEGLTTLSDTWSWDGAQWTELRPTVSPPGLSGALLAYDPSTQRLVLTGGDTARPGGPLEETDGTWTWDGSTWASPAGGHPPGGRPAQRARHRLGHRAAHPGHQPGRLREHRDLAMERRRVGSPPSRDVTASGGRRQPRLRSRIGQPRSRHRPPGLRRGGGGGLRVPAGLVLERLLVACRPGLGRLGALRRPGS